jgi:hypothetical protein
MSNVPSKATRRWKGRLLAAFDRSRNAVERMFCRLKSAILRAARFIRPGVLVRIAFWSAGAWLFWDLSQKEQHKIIFEEHEQSPIPEVYTALYGTRDYKPGEFYAAAGTIIYDGFNLTYSLFFQQDYLIFVGGRYDWPNPGPQPLCKLYNEANPLGLSLKATQNTIFIPIFGLDDPAPKSGRFIPYVILVSRDLITGYPTTKVICVTEPALRVTYSRRRFHLVYDDSAILGGYTRRVGSLPGRTAPIQLEIQMLQADDIRIENEQRQTVTLYSEKISGKKDLTLTWTDIPSAEGRDRSLIWIGIFLAFAVGCAIELAKLFLELACAPRPKETESKIE